MRTEEQVFFERHKNRRTCFLKDIRTEEQVFFERHENRRTCFIPQPKNMFFCSPVLSLASDPHVLLFSCLTPRKQSPCSSVLLSYPRKQSPCSSVLLSYPRKQSPCSHVLLSYPSQAIPMFFCSPVLPLASNPHVLMFFCLPQKNMFSCLITMHIFLIPIKILNCFSLPFQISFILLYINILSLRKIENSIYTFYRNGTSTL